MHQPLTSLPYIFTSCFFKSIFFLSISLNFTATLSNIFCLLFNTKKVKIPMLLKYTPAYVFIRKSTLVRICSHTISYTFSMKIICILKNVLFTYEWVFGCICVYCIPWKRIQFKRIAHMTGHRQLIAITKEMRDIHISTNNKMNQLVWVI